LENLYILLLGVGGQTHSYIIFSKSIFYIRNRAVRWFRPITAYVLMGKNRFIHCLSTNSVYYFLWESLCLQFTSYV